jgi:menaquinone-dependent protoporphyrinogen oxidase
MLVLVVYGSERGGTAGLARMVGKSFAERGWSVEVRPARDVTAVTVADAVVVGGALYFNRWHHDAVRFVRQHAGALHDLPVWFCSSGPLDDSARSGDLAAVPQVEALAASVEIKGHMTFGGRLLPDAKGFLARRMAKTSAGDWRDAQQVREWVHQICTHDMPTDILVTPERMAAIDVRDAVPAQRKSRTRASSS